MYLVRFVNHTKSGTALIETGDLLYYGMYLNFEGLEPIEKIEKVEIFLVSPNETGYT